jgi:hypothetical protein
MNGSVSEVWKLYAATRHQFTIYVWVGIIGDLLITSYCLDSLDFECTILTKELRQLVESLLLTKRQTAWFVYDRAPAHFTSDVKQLLNYHYPHRQEPG